MFFWLHRKGGGGAAVPEADTLQSVTDRGAISSSTLTRTFEGTGTQAALTTRNTGGGRGHYNSQQSDRTASRSAVEDGTQFTGNLTNSAHVRQVRDATSTGTNVFENNIGTGNNVHHRQEGVLAAGKYAGIFETEGAQTLTDTAWDWKQTGSATTTANMHTFEHVGTAATAYHVFASAAGRLAIGSDYSEFNLNQSIFKIPDDPTDVAGTGAINAMRVQDASGNIGFIPVMGAPATRHETVTAAKTIDTHHTSADTTAGDLTLTLPNVNLVPVGKEFVISKEVLANTLTIDTTTGIDKIHGALFDNVNSITLGSATVLESVTVKNTGVKWRII